MENNENKKIKLGMVGMGERGRYLINTIHCCNDADITAVCDLYPDRVDNSAQKVNELFGFMPEKYTDYKELIKSENVDAVLITSAWESHIEIAIASMKAGKITALEVGGAYSIEECWDLVNTYEETGTPFMFMENCCYGKFELLTTALVREGKLGTVVHCHGAYSHDLRDEITGGNVNRHYRLRNYLNRNCENYPTHELGPIAKILNINRGNKMLSLVSVASKSAGLEEFTHTDACPDPSLAGTKFKQGDVISTIITCAGGETITLALDTSLPKYYSREFTIRGTRGLANGEAKMIMIEGECNTHKFFDNINNMDTYSEHLPDMWRNMSPEALASGHGGMDYFEFKEFFAAIREGREMPIDVYDAAAWMCITALSEMSIAQGGAPQAIPDFTRGQWLLREPKDVI